MRTIRFNSRELLLALSFLTLLLLSCICVCAEDLAAMEGENLPELPNDLIEALGHEEFKERHAAQRKLMAWGREDLQGSIEVLFSLYRKTENPEVRLRSREVLKSLVILKQPLPGQGYLGIQMDTGRWKDEVGMMHPAVLITDVRAGTAADLAQLRADDLITGVDGVLFDDLAPTRRLADYIKSKNPGDEIVLKVRRGKQGLELTASLRRRPSALDAINQWGVLPVLPQETEMDEDYFQEWLKKRRQKEGKSAKD